MLTIMSRRTPTAKDRKKAQTLKTLWEARKHDLDLTQNSASKELGLTQPTFSQYLNAIIPLNTDIIFKFAKLLQVTPQTVDPTLINISALMGIDSANQGPITVPLLGSTSGKSVLGQSPIVVNSLPAGPTYVGIVVDTQNFTNVGLTKGTVFCVNLDQEPFVPNQYVAIRMRGEENYSIYAYLSSAQTTYRLQPYGKPITIVTKKAQVAAAHLVVGDPIIN